MGFERESQKPRCTILWSSLRRQPYLVNWDPEDESSRGLSGVEGRLLRPLSPVLPALLMGWGGVGQGHI